MIGSFLFASLAAAVFASISGGIMGSFVVVKRLANLCGSISHSILGGMGFFLYLQKVHGLSFCHPMIGALLAALISAVLVGWIQISFRQRVDSIIAAIWSTGMSIGIIFLALTPGSSGDLSGFLLGNLLWITYSDLIWLFIMTTFIIGITFLCYRPFIAICFDEEQAYLQKIPVKKYYLLLLILIALTIVLLIQTIGVILTIALLTLPATTANLYTKKMSTLIGLSVAFCIGISGLGILISYVLDWPPGATIALTAALFYCSSLYREGFKNRKFDKEAPKI